MKLPLELEELRTQLEMDDPFHAGRGTLRVESVTVDGTTSRLWLQVAREPSEGRPERWQVWLPVDRDDLSAGISAEAFVAVLRGNVRERWDLKDSDPEEAARGRRLD